MLSFILYWFLAGCVGMFLFSISVGTDTFYSEDGPIDFNPIAYIWLGYFGLAAGVFAFLLIGPASFKPTMKLIKDRFCWLKKKVGKLYRKILDTYYEI